MNRKIKILLIEDNPDDARLIRDLLGEQSNLALDLEWVGSLSAGLSRLVKGGIDVALLNLSLPDCQGLNTLYKVHIQEPELAIVVIGDADDSTFDKRILNHGAQGFLAKKNMDFGPLELNIRQAIGRNLIEQRLRKSEERLRTIINSNADGMVLVDGNKVICFVNKAAEAIFGQEAWELIGEKFNFPLRINKKSNLNIIREKGTPVTVEMRVAEIEWAGETACLALLRDITEINKAKKKIELLANLVENAQHDMIIVVRPDGRIMQCNALAGKTFGYSKKKMCGKNIKDLFLLEKYGGWGEIAHTVESNLCWHGDLQAICSNDRNFPAAVTFSKPRNKKLAVDSMILFARDVTREKEIDSMKSEFISIASHELRTPLTSIKNSIDFIVKGKTGKTTVAQKKFLAMAQRNVKRLGELINDILNISRIEAGRMELEYSDIDIKRCIQNAVNALSPTAKAKSIQLMMDIPSKLPKIYGDAAKIDEAMINIVGNAIKFTPEKGKVIISAHQMEKKLDTTKSCKFLEVSVTDTGIGIPEELIDHIFDKFCVERESLSSDKQSGTGLGLAICKGIVEAHGGEIQCKSKKGKGSTFTFLFPIFDKEHYFSNDLKNDLIRVERGNEQLSIIIIKINGFESIKKIYGKEEISKALEFLKKVIKEKGLRAHDKINAIPSKGEVVIVVFGVGRDGSLILRKKMVQHIASKKTVIGSDNHELSFISGTATFPDDRTTAEEFINYARKSMSDNP